MDNLESSSEQPRYGGWVNVYGAIAGEVLATAASAGLWAQAEIAGKTSLVQVEELNLETLIALGSFAVLSGYSATKIERWLQRWHS